ncbi:MAG: DUF541 domain-containing protein [Nevskiaceae bacterium]|nr:MAG: DUF541 domain-containing protein [Nevskiaceae bacterium]
MKPALLLLPLFLFAAAVQANDDPAAQRRSVNVNGQGEVTTQPDRARLSLGVEASNVELKAAEADVNKAVRAYLVEAKSLGLKDEQISTAGVTINPEYVWDDKARRQKFTGYKARRQIDLRVDDLTVLGDLILRATKVGINQVNSPVLESSKAKELTRQALVKATEDARSKAQLLADTLNVKLGAIRSLSANDSAPPPVMYKVMAMRAMAAPEADGGNAEMGFSGGEIKYSANVSADFDLIAP